MTYVEYDWKAMAKDPEGHKILKGGIREMVEGWKELDPEDPDLQDTEELIELAVDHVEKTGSI